MKPCSKQRELVAAGLAAGALDSQQERKVRAHLESCPGCRRYWEELSRVTEKLAGVEIRSDIQTSEAFHRRLKARLSTEATPSPWQAVLTVWRTGWSNWRVALPALGVIALGIALASVYAAKLRVVLPTQGRAPVVIPQIKRDPDPTVANYQRVANQSLEQLDELLTRQGNRNPSPGPMSRASLLALADAP